MAREQWVVCEWTSGDDQCPWFRPEADGSLWCTYGEERKMEGPDLDDSEPAPSWCHLREGNRGPITIRLMED